MQVGLIGFGRLGKLIAKKLAKDFSLSIYDKENYEEEIVSLGARPASLKEVASCPIVIPFVPISSFEECIKELAPLLHKDSLVIDVCSVKELPIKTMTKYLPKNIQILGTHPMFGPDSAKTTLFGSKIALCPERINPDLYQDIKKYLEANGIKVIETTAIIHDKEISHSLVLTHLIGRTLIDFKAKDLLIDTKGYRRLMKILEVVENDSIQLFHDMNTYNPYAKEMRDDFLNSLKNTLRLVE